MAIKMIDDSILQDIAESIQAKDGLGKMTPGQMPGRIDNINGGGDVPNPDDPLLLVDWDGTLLYSYTYEEAQLISEFPDPPAHEGLTFQRWNWSEVVVKTWLQNHRGAQLRVGATYTPADGQDHGYWRSPRLTGNNQAYKWHLATPPASSIPYSSNSLLNSISLPNGTTSIVNSAFINDYTLKFVVLPSGVTNIGSNAFYQNHALSNISSPDSLRTIGATAFYCCFSLLEFILPNGLTTIGDSAFNSCYSIIKMEIPASVTLIGNYAFRSCTSLVDVVLHGKPSLGGSVVFGSNPSNQRFYVHRSDLSWFETATNWAAIYADGKIVAAADYIEYLQSIGIDTTDFEGE